METTASYMEDNCMFVSPTSPAYSAAYDYAGDCRWYAAVKKLFLDAFGNETVIAVALSMVLFAGVSYVGCTKYMSRFFLSWKVLEGRPYIFIFIILLCAYVVSGLTNPLAAC